MDVELSLLGRRFRAKAVEKTILQGPCRVTTCKVGGMPPQSLSNLCMILTCTPYNPCIYIYIYIYITPVFSLYAPHIYIYTYIYIYIYIEESPRFIALQSYFRHARSGIACSDQNFPC